METHRENEGCQIQNTLHSAMSVVSRLCSKMEPQDVSSPCPPCFKHRYEDQTVADGAPKYFALLADRFIRKGLNPAPLAENGRMDSQGKKTQRQLIECIRSKDTDVETGQV